MFKRAKIFFLKTLFFGKLNSRLRYDAEFIPSYAELSTLIDYSNIEANHKPEYLYLYTSGMSSVTNFFEPN